MSFSPGENVGPYRVIEQLGSGGMATVFKAYHASLDRYVAIKVLHPAFKADPQFFERFKREARIVANLEHPNIIPVYDFNEHNGEPYLVMRFIEGDTLKPELEGQPMAPEKVLALMRPICQALSYAHKQGVLHRDIKPSNIMITTDGSVFLTDFGLARMVQAGESTLSQDMMVGTPQYISPEQAQGVSGLDGRTDIYSLGVVLFEMLTGQVPFNADTPFATIHDHIYTPLPLPGSLNPDIDPAVERLLLKALAKEQDDRFETAEELLDALDNTLGPQIAAGPTATKTAVRSRKGGLPWWAWAGAAALILCIVFTLFAGLLAARRQNRNASAGNDQPVSGAVADAELPSDEAQLDDTPPPDIQSDVSDGPVQDNDETNDQAEPDTLPAGELTRQASQALQDRQLAEAIELYEQAVEADPHHLPAYYGLNEALRQSGDPEAGLAALEEAVQNNPDFPGPYLRLGEAQLFTAENPEAALDAFVEAAALAPDAAMPYAGQAIALLSMDQNAEAKEAIDTALALDQSIPEAHLANAVFSGPGGGSAGSKTGSSKGIAKPENVAAATGPSPPISKSIGSISRQKKRRFAVDWLGGGLRLPTWRWRRSVTHVERQLRNT